jgi:hypothetical protein
MASNYEVGSKISQVLGFFNASCSLGIIFFYWKLDFFKKKRTFMTYLVFITTIFQCLQDLAIGYQTLCPPIIDWDDDTEAPWISNKNQPLQCSGSEWWIEEFSGLMLQFLTLFMSCTVLYVVYFTENLKFNKIMPYYIAVTFTFSVVLSSLDVWGAYYCDKRKSWTCPDAKNRDMYTPGNVGFLGSEFIRLSMAFLSLLIIFLVLVFLQIRRNTGGTNSVGLLSFMLAKRILLYPTVQVICRLPSLYLFLHGGVTVVDLAEHEEGLPPDVAESRLRTRLAGYYIFVVLSPMGGFLSLLAFIYIHDPAQVWLRSFMEWRRQDFTGESEGGTLQSSLKLFGNTLMAGIRLLHPATLFHKLDEEDIMAQIEEYRREESRQSSQSEVPRCTSQGSVGGVEAETDLELYPHSPALRETNNPLHSDPQTTQLEEFTSRTKVDH